MKQIPQLKEKCDLCKIIFYSVRISITHPRLISKKGKG